MKHWAMFFGLGLIWGSSFLLIKTAVAPDGAVPAQVGLLDPLSLVTARLGLAALGFIVLTLTTRRSLPHDRKTLLSLVILGLTNYALPFILITWGERTIDSGLASVLNSTTPLFSLVIAHLALADDRISIGKILGLISGFAGIVLLATRSIDPLHPNPLSGQLAILGAALAYGASAVFIRKSLHHVDGMVTATVSMSAAAIIVGAMTLLTVRPLPVLTALQPSALASILILGLLNTFVAYVLYFNIIHVLGASRTTLVTYLLPPIGLFLGVVIRSEVLDWKLLLGSALIVGGVALANLWRAPVTESIRSISLRRGTWL